MKVGKTRNLRQRVRALDNTSVPMPFRCEYAAKVDDMDEVEKLLHDAFGDRRVRDNREFFEIDPMRVASALKLAGGKEVTPDDDIAEDEAGIRAMNKATQMRASFNFDLVDIPVGSTLLFSRDKTITAEVFSKKKILFEGAATSLSSAALTIVQRLGKKWSRIHGPSFWLYDEETVSERRDRMEREAEHSLTHPSHFPSTSRECEQRVNKNLLLLKSVASILRLLTDTASPPRRHADRGGIAPVRAPHQTPIAGSSVKPDTPIAGNI